MTKFDDLPYVRPDMEAFEAEFRAALREFGAAGSAEGQAAAFARLSSLRNGFETAASMVEIRQTRNTLDPFYEAENDFMDEAKPRVEGLESELSAALASSPFRPELERRLGRQLFRLAELKMKTWKPEILEDLQAENRLGSEYVRLKASVRVPFEGEERNLTELLAFAESPDRGMRKRATAAIAGFYRDHEAEFDRIYDELVRLRDGIARKLGFPNFVPLAYARLGRSDYGAEAVAGYRRQVHATVVPLAAALRRRQAARLGLSSLEFHDEALEFLSGNPEPSGGAAGIVANGLSMFAAMSKETGDFFRLLSERGLYDLETRKGKAAGGYCSYLPTERVPYIFANFNGTAEDVDTFSHECGHAFQVYRSGLAARGVPDYDWPTLEACEIHSMSMEFLAWPWMDSFFGKDAAKYRFRHLSAGILFLPYGVLVDEFQHWVYGNPQVSPAERKAAWRGLERKYLPWRDYSGDEFLERGGFWFRQGHIFQDPFYYIDYTLAQVSAYEFWGKAGADRGAAWASYLSLCDLGGSESYLELLRRAGLRSPFAEGAVEAIMKPVREWLDAADDRGM